MRSITFLIDGMSDIRVTLTEQEDGSIRFDITSESGAALDLRALFFDFDAAFSGDTSGLSIAGDDIDLVKIGDADVTKIGGGTSIEGSVVNEFGAFDGGVSFHDTLSGDGTSTSFTLSSSFTSLDLDMFSLTDFAIRTDGGEPKAGDTSTMALLAVDDAFEIAENTTSPVANLLGNDRQSDGLVLSGVTANGADIAFAAWSDVTTDGGRTGQVRVFADGSFEFRADTSFDDLNVDHTDTLTLRYDSVDAFGSRDGAEISILVLGRNDAPTVAAALIRETNEDTALRVDLLEGASDLDIGAILTAVDVTEATGQGGWSLDGNAVVLDPAYFNSLNQATEANLVLNYFVADEWGARVAQQLSVRVIGLNDQPTVLATLSREVTEDDAGFSVDLLEGADDPDVGAILSATGLSEADGKGGWSQNGNSIEIDPNTFNHLNEGASEDLSFNYLVEDEWGASVEQSLSVRIAGRNDAPTVAAPLEFTVSEEDAAFAVDLLAGASDVDDGAVLNAADLIEAYGQEGWTLLGNTIQIDPNYFDHLNDGETGILSYDYSIRDEFGGEIAQTLTINVEGYTDAPFVYVEMSAGAAANVVHLTISTVQARNEDVALSFGSLPEGAVIRDASFADVTGGVADALGITNYTMHFPLGVDIESFTVTVAGLEPDGSIIGTRDAQVALDYEGTTTTNQLNFAANDKNIWGEGEEVGAHWSKYIPLLGGDRKYFDLLDASTDLGQVFIKSNEIEWIPGDAYDTLLLGETQAVEFSYTYIEVDKDGVPVEGAVETTETYTIEAKGGNFFTEFSGEFVTTREEVISIEPLKGFDVLHDPLSTGVLELINIDIDSDEIFSGLIDPLAAARDGFAQQLAEDEAKLAIAINDRDALANEFALLGQLTGQNIEVGALTVAYEAAAFAVDAVENVVDALQSTLDAANSVLSGARTYLRRREDITDDKYDAYRASATKIWGVTVYSPTKYAAYVYAAGVEATARTAVNVAQKAVNTAQSALNDYLANPENNFLVAARDAALDALNDAKADVAATEDALRNEGHTSFDADDIAVALATVGANLTAAQGEILYFETTTLALQGLKASAQLLLDGAVALVETTDFRTALYAAVEAYAQAGFQFDFAVSGGAVDASVDYELTTISGYNETTDVLTIEVTLASMTTDGDVAFSTISPNVQIYAGLLYDMGANFEFMVDFYAAVLDLVLADLSPDSDGLTIMPMPNMQGSVDFVDFDSRDGDSLTFGISGGSDLSPEFLEFTLAVPTIETLGREADPSMDYYEEGDFLTFDINELLGSVQNLLEARIDLSPEMKALLNQAGVDPADPAAGQFLEALAQALGVALKSAIGEGDTDGDGVVPMFLLDATDETNGALLHINAIGDDTADIDPDALGQFGFYASYGESDRIFEVSLDVDQLIAVLANRALGNPSPIVFNPVDLEFGLEDALQMTSVDEETAAKIANWFDLNLNAELLDLDVSTGLNFSQEFTMSIDQFNFVFEMEDGTTITRTADDPVLTLENASQYDKNGDGSIEYGLTLTPDASFSNDTELGLGFSYALDFIKTSLSAGINIPLETIFPNVDLLGLGSDNIEFDLFNSAIGPLFRVQGDIDAVSLDLFEDRFALDLGTETVDLSTDEFILA